MDGKAIILTDGMLDQHYAKTAHGLIRGTDRYQIVALIDHVHAGKDAGVVLDGRHRDIPIFSYVGEYLEQRSGEAQYMVIGVATKGGYIPQEMRHQIRVGIEGGLHIVNGLHQFLADDPELSALARSKGVDLIDIRKPRAKNQLQFWTGAIAEVTCPKIAVLGTDCAIGKRTTARMLVQAAQDQGLSAEMVYTGQTGWLQGGKYGFIFDSTYNDFVSGELEHAVVSCFRDLSPDMIFLEGQAALLNPTGPCGAEFLVSARADGVVLQHAPHRKYFGNDPQLGVIPPLERDLELIRLYGSRTLAVTLNTLGLSRDQADAFQEEYRSRLDIPVFQPLKDGVEGIIPLILQAYA